MHYLILLQVNIYFGTCTFWLMSAKKLTFDTYWWIDLFLPAQFLSWVTQTLARSARVLRGLSKGPWQHPTGHDVKAVGSRSCGPPAFLGDLCHKSLQRGRSRGAYCRNNPGSYQTSLLLLDRISKMSYIFPFERARNGSRICTAE